MNPSIRLALLAALALQPLVATAALPDLDRDGIPNITDTDVDNDGLRNGADRNIDGGVAVKGPLRGRYIGDQLSNNAAAELDMDADGLADKAPNETDIDGDGLADNAANETDIDGDGTEDGHKAEADIDGDGLANGADADVDGDGLANSADRDFDGTGEVEDFLVDAAGNFVDDASVQPVIDLVTTAVRQQLNLSANDAGLKVRVQPSWLPGVQTGAWRYLSADNMQVWARWSYRTDNPDEIKLFVNYEYTGPHAGRFEDYTNPANYKISDERRFYGQYPRGPFTFLSWLPGDPVSFFYAAPDEQASGRPVPVAALNAALAAYPNFYTDGRSFAGDLVPTLTSLQPVLELQRQLQKATRSASARLETAQITAESAAASKLD